MNGRGDGIVGLDLNSGWNCNPGTRMVLDLHDFDKLSIWACAADLHAHTGEDTFIGVVEFIPVPVAFRNLFLSIGC